MKLITLVVTALLSISVMAADVPQKPVQKGHIDFGLVPYHGQRTQVLTLSNNSLTEPLTDISAKISGNFFLKHSCPTTLNAGESCHAHITFWATHQGYHVGRLTVRTSAMDYHYDLSGFGDRDPLADLPKPPVPQPPRP